MIQYFCDVCKNPIAKNYVDERLNVAHGEFTIEVLVTKNGVSNTGEICKKCLLKILNTGDEI